MATFVRTAAGTDLANLASAGYGVAWRHDRKAPVVAGTIGCRSWERAGLPSDAERVRKDRQDRPAGVSGEMVDVSRVAFDLMARAGCVAHGIRDGSPYAARKRAPESQCEGEANHAIAVLEGLNVVGEDLVSTTLLGATVRRNLVADGVADEVEGVKALARLALRAMADGEDAAGLAARVAALKAALDEGVASLGPRA